MAAKVVKNCLIIANSFCFLWVILYLCAQKSKLIVMVTEIKNGIYYVGVNDRNKHRFEGLWPLPNGVSYNSYVIVD